MMTATMTGNPTRMLLMQLRSEIFVTPIRLSGVNSFTLQVLNLEATSMLRIDNNDADNTGDTYLNWGLEIMTWICAGHLRQWDSWAA